MRRRRWLVGVLGMTIYKTLSLYDAGMLLVSASEGTAIVALSLPLARSRNKNLLLLSASAFVLSAEIVIDPSSTLMSISSLSMPYHHTRKLRCCAAPERSCKGMKDQDCKVHNNKNRWIVATMQMLPT